MKTVNLSQRNLVPLIEALKENTEDDNFILGMEPNAPVGGAYFHVSDDDEDEVNEIYDNYDEYYDMISESTKIITESKNTSRAKKQTISVLSQALNMSPDDERVFKLEDKFRVKVFLEMHLTSKEYDRVIRYEPLFMKCALEIGFPENFDFVDFCGYTGHIIRNTKNSENSGEIIRYYADNIHSFNDLKRIVEAEIDEKDKASQAEMQNMTVNLNKNYDVIGPLTFEQSRPYGDNSGDGVNPKSRICYTQNESIWLSPMYSNNNRNKLYMLLRKDWKNIRPTHDGSEKENGLQDLNGDTGYDNYGLSMIMAFISRFGKLSVCNTRWNHEATYASGRGVDHALTEIDIARLMGAPFEQVFGVNQFDYTDEVKKRLENGEAPEDIFYSVEECGEGNLKVMTSEYAYNYVSRDGKLLWDKPYDEWFGYADSFENGYAWVRNKAGKYGILSTTGYLLGEKWFDFVGTVHFDDETGIGYSKVCTDGKYNFVTTEGIVLWNKPEKYWFDYADNFDFKEKISTVVKYVGIPRYNYLTTNGNLLWKESPEEWFISASDFYQGVACCQKSDRKYYYFRKDGTFLIDKGFDYGCDFCNGVAIVRDGMDSYYLDLNGNLKNIMTGFRESTESKPNLITESKNVSRAKKQTIAYLAQRLNVESHESIILQNLESKFRADIFDSMHLTSKEYDRVIMYEPMLIKCALDAGFPNNINNQFMKYSKYIINKTKDSENPSEIIARYKNISSYDELQSVVGEEIRADKEASKAKMSQLDLNLNKNYDVLGPLSFEESQEYGNESGNLSNTRSRICYTQGKGTWLTSNYSNFGQNKCFLLLRKDWKTVPCEHDGSQKDNGLGVLSNYSGYDNYGLSMIFLFIDEYGDLVECNTRWNHEADYGPNRGVDHALTEDDISKLMGSPFEQLFGIEKKDPFEEINERIEKGESVVDLCDISVRFSDGSLMIYYKAKNICKYNFVKKDGALLWNKPVNEWFDDIKGYNEGIVTIRIKGLENAIREDATFVWDKPYDEWFRFCGVFLEGFACVSDASGRWNFINTEGKIISKRWFKGTRDFINGYGRVILDNRKRMPINKNGDLVGKMCYDWIDVYYEGFAVVEEEDLFNFIDTEGNLLKAIWYTSVEEFHEGFAEVEIDGRYNFIDKNGNYLWKHQLEDWFDEVSRFNSGFSPVKYKGKWYKLAKDGKLYDGISGDFVFESNERKKSLLNESKNSSKAKSQTLAMLAQVFKTEPDSEEAISTEQIFRKEIFDSLHLTNKEYDRVIKYEPLFMRCALDIGYESNLSFLKKYTDYIIFKTKDSQNPSEVMSRYASANSFMDLYRLVIADMKADNEADVKLNDKAQYTFNQNYEVLGPLSFEESQVYGNESGENGEGQICYTQGEETWLSSNYSDKNQNKCYLLLRKDWKTVPCEHDGSEANNGIGELSEYNGYDSYGLSMIFLFITPYGELHECNTRWNHRAKYAPGRGVDHALTENDIAKLMGAPFEKVFGVKKTDPYAEINERIANDESIEDLCEVCKYFSAIDGYGVLCGGKRNLIGKDGRVICKRPVKLWFDAIGEFENGFACVRIGRKFNYLRTDGTFLWGFPIEKWLDFASTFYDGFARVCFHKKWNFIRTDGTLVWDYPPEKWFDDIFEFNGNGLALVEVGKKENYLREDGTLLWDYPVDEWFDEISHNSYNGLVWVRLNKKFNWLRIVHGTLLWDYPPEKWFDDMGPFVGGVAKVCFKRNWYKLSLDGKLYDKDGNLVSESKNSKKTLITESKNSSRAKSQTLAILAQALGAEPDSEETINAEQVFRKKIFDELHLTNKEYDRVIKYEPLFMRCAIDVGYPYSLNLSKISKYTNRIIFKTKDSPNPSEVMSRYMGANSFMDLYRLVKADIKADKEAGVEVEDNTQYDLNQNYDVLGPLSFNEAQVYGDESGDLSNTHSRICYTQGKGTWEGANYSDINRNKCFLLLRKDWKTVPCEHDGSEQGNGLGVLSEYNGYDNYGLSMIFVFIEPNGDLHECNTRWNHEANYGPCRGVDHALNEDDIVNLMGAPFEKVFGVKKTESYSYINERILNDESIVNHCELGNYCPAIDGYYVSCGGKQNLIRYDGRVICKRPVELWFDMIYYFANGFAPVRLNEKWNLINKEGNFASKRWFDDVRYFIDGYSKVRIGSKWNFLRLDGTLVWDYPPRQWFDDIEEFDKNGVARVKIGEKENFLKQDGTLLWDYPVEKWFDVASTFSYGFSRVAFFGDVEYYEPYDINPKVNFIRKDGTLFWDKPVDEWFNGMSRPKDGISCVRLREKWNWVREDGTFVWNRPVEEWFNADEKGAGFEFTHGFMPLKINGKFYGLSLDGKLRGEDGKQYNNRGELVSESKERSHKCVILSEDKLLKIRENLEDEVESSEVDLSSFKKKDMLQPSIWKDSDTLDSRVRLKLLDIADDFWEYVNLSWVEPKGIILTGSICNFNWSRFSDIDLHLIVDFNEVDEKSEFVRDYFDMKKNEWNNEHKALRIKDFNVELYVQDIDDDVDSGGIYDLEENKWIRKPDEEDIKPISLEKFGIKRMSAKIMTIIDDMFAKLNSTDDKHIAEVIGDDAKHLWDKVKKMRTDSLDKDGEMGAGNVVYKVLRRTGYLDKLFSLRSASYDEVNSISESMIQYIKHLKTLNEEVVADGNAEHNPYSKRWKAEREALKNFLNNNGRIMTSRENGKQYKCYWDEILSNLIGYNYCICIQWDPIKMEVKSTPYIRALDKFTYRIFNAQFDDRGRDNMRGTYDDVYNYNYN